MTDTIRIKKGLDIPLQGKAEGAAIADTLTSTFGIVPDDFPGIRWKAAVKPGDKVLAGSPLLTDKETGLLALTSPVAGSVTEVRRGERRKILAVCVRREGEQTHLPLTTGPDAGAAEIRAALQTSGLWAWMRQRPFDIVPSPDSQPRDIFVTAFDSAPLAPALLGSLDEAELQAGVDALRKLTEGDIHIGLPAGASLKLRGAVTTIFEGPHPAGNVGTQIAAIRPVNKGETVWTLDIAALAKIGHLMLTGEADFSTTVAVTGPAALSHRNIRTEAGASIETLLKEELPADASHIRIVSGNALTGVRLDTADGFLRFPYRQITILPEGDNADEFMGWASMSPKKFSVKRTFPAFLRDKSVLFPFDARIKGGRRAMIMSGEYDRVFPFDIYPEYLVKAILASDIDRMEQLGIYEVAPEDFALPEFVDTSKLELQKIVREGLDRLREEL